MKAKDLVNLWLLHLNPALPAGEQFQNLLAALLGVATEDLEPLPDGKDDPYHGLEWREFEAAVALGSKLSDADLARQVAKLSSILLANTK